MVPDAMVYKVSHGIHQLNPNHRESRLPVQPSELALVVLMILLVQNYVMASAIGDPTPSGRATQQGFIALWGKEPSAKAPEPRYYGAMAYDTRRGDIVLFGGQTDSEAFGDTWIAQAGFTGWSRVSSVSAPSPRDRFAMAYDALADKVVLYGGCELTRNCNTQTWVFDSTTSAWTNVTPLSSPAIYWGHSMGYDPGARKVVLYGGVDSVGPNSQTWLYDSALNSWTNAMPPSAPKPRYFSAMTYDPVSSSIMLFGGQDNTRAFNDTWTYSVSSNSWIQGGTTTVPSDRHGHSMTFDPKMNMVVLYGGCDAIAPTTCNSETWTYDSSERTWAPLSTYGAPTATWGHSMVYDTIGRKLLLFGGNGPGGPSGDAWTLGIATRTPPQLSMVVRTDRAVYKPGDRVALTATLYPQIGQYWYEEPGVRIHRPGVPSYMYDVIRLQNGSYRAYFGGEEWESAISSDLLTWTREGLILSGGGSLDPTYVTFGNVLRLANGTYRMYYGAQNGNFRQVATAVSTDGLRWTKDNVIRVPVGSSGALDDNGLYSTAIIALPNGTLRMYYTAWSLSSPGSNKVMSATSIDGGVTWIKENKILLPIPGDAFPEAADLHVVSLSNGTFRGVYYVLNRTDMSFERRVTFSNDGLTWVDETQHTPLPGIGPIYVLPDGSWRLFYTKDNADLYSVVSPIIRGNLTVVVISPVGATAFQDSFTIDSSTNLTVSFTLSSTARSGFYSIETTAVVDNTTIRPTTSVTFLAKDRHLEPPPWPASITLGASALVAVVLLAVGIVARWRYLNMKALRRTSEQVERGVWTSSPEPYADREGEVPGGEIMGKGDSSLIEGDRLYGKVERHIDAKANRGRYVVVSSKAPHEFFIKDTLQEAAEAGFSNYAGKCVIRRIGYEHDVEIR